MDNAQRINQTSLAVEFGTPPRIIEAAKRVLGKIDLDPASSPTFNRLVNAEKIFTADDDGLSRPWHGKVWMNHPFRARERVCGPNCQKKRCRQRGYHVSHDVPGNEDWIDKLVKEYTQGNVKEALCITYASTSEAWFKPLLAWPQCFIYGRVNYISSLGYEMKGATKGSVVTYFGYRLDVFRSEFSDLGEVKVSLDGSNYL